MFIYFTSSLADKAVNPEGKDIGSVGVSGQLIYLVVVMFVNNKILLSSHNINFFSWFFCYASTIVYLVFFWLLSVFRIPGAGDIYLEVNFVVFEPITYVVLLLIGCACAGLDEGWQMTKRMLRVFEDIQVNAQRKIDKQKVKKDPAFVHRRLTSFDCKLIKSNHNCNNLTHK